MLYLLGHMRSGSTLLVHILASHPDILGYGETQSTYGRNDAQESVAWNVHRRFGRFKPRETYVMDKILHDHLGFPAWLGGAGGNRAVLLAREPKDTLRSILQLEYASDWSQAEALGHYILRLKALKDLARENDPRKWAFLTYQELVGSPEATLEKLTTFLHLREPLRAEYDLMWSTGLTGIGDDSRRIRAGRISDEKTAYRVDLRPGILQLGDEAFQEAVTTITSWQEEGTGIDAG